MVGATRRAAADQVHLSRNRQPKRHGVGDLGDLGARKRADRSSASAPIQICGVDAANLELVLAATGDRVAGVLVEPLVQATAGMRIQPRGYLRRVRELCDAHRLPLICDEVTTGFGRTGRMFACEHEQVTPDLLCVGNGLTGGYLPLAATITTELIYDGFLGRAGFEPIPHPATLTGNPLACAAAIATLQTFDAERTLELLEPKIGLLSRLLEQRIAVLPGVAEVRQLGVMVGIELAGPRPGAGGEGGARGRAAWSGDRVVR